MLSCLDCKSLIDRKVAKKNSGVCDNCFEFKKGRHEITNDLLASFSGKGKRGFVQWLKFGKFLQGIESDADIHRHNDRIDVIESLIGKDKFDRLLDGIADVILNMAGESNE